MAVALGAVPVLLATNGATVLARSWVAVAAAVLAWLVGREPRDG
jgi:hypothetical protein